MDPKQLKLDSKLTPLILGLCFALSAEELQGVSAQQLPPQLYKTLGRLHVQQTDKIIVVNVKNQTLTLFEEGLPLLTYPVSTAKRGVGCCEGTFQTPLGLHRIKRKIGNGAPDYGQFVGRSFTGKVWQASPGGEKGDMVLTRIMWLEGLEEGKNRGRDSRGRNVDSFDRYIYLHGTNHEKSIGKPASQGCVRMLSTDIVSLFDRVEENTLVWITE